MKAPPAPNARLLHRPEPEYIAVLIDLTGLSQEELCVCIDIDTRQLRRYLRGETPTPYVVQFAIEHLATYLAGNVDTHRELLARSNAELERERATVQRALKRAVSPSRQYLRLLKQLELLEGAIAAKSKR